jgi:hypothetical protein
MAVAIYLRHRSGCVKENGFCGTEVLKDLGQLACHGPQIRYFRYDSHQPRAAVVLGKWSRIEGRGSIQNSSAPERPNCFVALVLICLDFIAVFPLVALVLVNNLP